jgi:hypothetical protein
MATLDVLSKAIESLAWPSALVASILILRRPIARLVLLLRRLRFRDLEIDFERRVEAVVERRLAALRRNGDK